MVKAVPVAYAWSIIGHRSIKEHNIFYLWVENGFRERLGDAWFEAVKKFAERVISCFLQYAVLRHRMKKAVRRIRMARVVAQIAPDYPEHLAQLITEFIL